MVASLFCGLASQVRIMPIAVNALETARFGVVAARLVNEEADPVQIDAAAAELGVALLTVRVPVTELSRVHAFEAAGYRLMDTLLYFCRTLDQPPEPGVREQQLQCRLAVPADAAAVAEVAAEAFAGYLGHYHADPRLDAAAADAAYVEWAQSSTTNASSTAPVLVAEHGDRIIGFLTMRRNDDAEMEIVLNGVRPAFHGKGAYGILAREALARAHALGCARVVTSTQINNYPVQRIWARLGFIHVRSLYTFHKWF